MGGSVVYLNVQELKPIEELYSHILRILLMNSYDLKQQKYNFPPVPFEYIYAFTETVIDY